MGNTFRKLRADEIECRVATVKENGISLLLYKDARCDMNILDETVGSMNWQRSHSRDNANCTVSIWDETKKQWVPKEDTGTESNTEKEKGLASDSFKRACFNWGIGRELYTAPFIWVPAGLCNITSKSARHTCYDRFYVSQVTYTEDGRIKDLEVKNSKTHKAVFSTSSDATPTREKNSPESAMANEDLKQKIRDICTKHKIDIAFLYSSNGITESTMTEKQAEQFLDGFKKKYGGD